ncbi:antibiotic biosynthesis monooxygenase family protein [Pseudonocardia kunmingensis]|uniref:Antibiotic biosynthesis monooxygenase n=1 Tax=Pseudonocardia kunmingensis TaxID=630975 RepID=A0A543DNK4_9PSEU|nr:antibiotic biosynthesis monooxygenase family protein [Pseudonocardia kunmingensis]TQM10914.1 antibiotic biosynthesis monooxygenase [Pseudonocardia kunmingensis]
MTDNGITFINVFEIPADQLDEFIEQWRERAQLMRKAPGFRDVRLHRAISPDARFPLVNVAHWDSAEACEAAGGHPAVVASVESARTVAVANPALYDVVAEHR